MTELEVEEAAGQIVDALMARCVQNMTPEQCVDFLMAMRELIDDALRYALSATSKN